MNQRNEHLKTALDLLMEAGHHLEAAGFPESAEEADCRHCAFLDLCISQIVMRLLCATGRKHRYQETQITASCENEDFTAKGKVVLDHGWTATEQCFRKEHCKTEKEEANGTTALPKVQKGQHLKPVDVTITDHFTSPPKAYTEDTLLAAMETAGNKDFDKDTEKKGLGTPATRAGILEKLISRVYSLLPLFIRCQNRSLETGHQQAIPFVPG